MAVLSGMPGHVLSPKNCTFAWGDLEPHLINGSLGPPASKSQTAPRLVQPFFGKAHGTELLYFRTDHSFPPLLKEDMNPHLIHGSLGPQSHMNPELKWHLDRLSRFCRAHYCDRQTDKPRYSVGNNRPHLRSYVVYVVL